MLFFLTYFIHSSIFDYTVPHIFDTIDDYNKYDPNIYNYEIINKEFNFNNCFNRSEKKLKECIDYSIKKFYNPLSLITKNNPPLNNLKKYYSNKSQNSIAEEMQIQTFWLKCAQLGNNKCAELYDTFNFFHIENYPEQYLADSNEENGASLFIQLKEAHNLMYKIKHPQKIILNNQSNLIQKVRNDNETENQHHEIKYSILQIQSNQNNEFENFFESEVEREVRFQKVYEILKPISFFVFDKYIRDHFGYLRPLRRINQTLVEDMLGYKRAYQHELRILLEGKETTKDPSWMFEDLLYPEVARLFLDIVTRRKEGPEKPLNEIYSNLLIAKYPYLFENGFDTKKKFITKNGSNKNLCKKFNGIQKVDYKENIESENDEGFKDYDDEFIIESESNINGNEFYEFYYNSEDDGYDSNEYIYDYIFNSSIKNLNKKISMKKKMKSQNHIDSLNFLNADKELNYNEISSKRIRHAFDLCRNYLQNVRNIEDVNQSNLTITISTIYGIASLFNYQTAAHYNHHRKHSSTAKRSKHRELKKMHFFDEFDTDHRLTGCKLFDEGLYYLMIAARNGGIKAAEALLFKFLLLIKDDQIATQKVDNYFKFVINCLDQNQQSTTLNESSNIYMHYHSLFPPLVADFFDAIIFFDERARELFQVDQIVTFNTSYQFQNFECNGTINNSNILNVTSEKVVNFKNPRNWTYEDAAKALRAFIDSSLLVHVGHLAEESLSSICHSSLLTIINGYLVYTEEKRKKVSKYIVNKFSHLFENNKSANDKIKNKNVFIFDDNEKEIIVNQRKMNKRIFLYALRIYQTLAMSGNRDAMWNAHILMKAANIPSQIFTMFITDSNETVFLHELDARHRRSQKASKSNANKKEFEMDDNSRTIGQFVFNYLSSWFAFLLDSISNTLNISSSNTTSLIYSNQIDYEFYEEISDRDPYAAFILAWKKRGNLTAAYELLDKTEKMKPEATVAVVISKLMIATISFVNTVFKGKAQASIPMSSESSNSITNSSSFNIFGRFFNLQKYEKIIEFVKSTPYLPEVLLGLGILSALAFFIYVRISLYCD